MIRVAITGLHRGNNPQPGAAVAASLRRRFADLHVIGLSYDPLESALYCHDGGRPDVAYLMPFPGAGAQATLDRLDEILQSEPIDYLIPCLDSELDNYIELQPALEARGIACVLPSQRALDDRAKANLYRFCQPLDVPTLRTLAAADADTLAALALQIGYPVYVKGRFYEAHLATTPKELYEAFNAIASVWGTPVLVQEMAVGEEYDVLGVGDGQGGLLASCSIRKMLRTSAGKGFAGVVIADPALDRQVERIIAALGGPVRAGIHQGARPAACPVRDESALPGLGRFPLPDRLQHAGAAARMAHGPDARRAAAMRAGADVHSPQYRCRDPYRRSRADDHFRLPHGHAGRRRVPHSR